MTNPSKQVPILTIKELPIQIQNDSPPSIFLKCSVEKESPISPPSAFPGEMAISKIHIRGNIVISTK